MKNSEIAAIFYAIADILEMQNVQWKPQAYRRVARAIESLSKDVQDLYNEKRMKGLLEIAGVGEGLAKKIAEYIETGKVNEYEKLKKSLPKGLSELLEISGMGPKKAKILYNELKVQSISDLEKVANVHEIAKLKGFGQKSEENILKGIELFKRGRERMYLGNALAHANMIISQLKKIGGVNHIEAAGSLRRRRETVGDIDILVTTKNQKATNEVMDVFTSLQDVAEILAKGQTKSAVLLKNGIQTDVRVLKDEEFGSALQYFTGSKEHNIAVRTIAIKKGMKLSEYGLFKGSKKIAGEDEEGIYKALGMQMIPSEMRENTGEIEAAIKGNLPKVIEYDEIKGDFHVHTTDSDGDNTVEEVVNKALDLGYEYICITDHSKAEHIANGMTEERLLKQISEIEALNKKFKSKNFRIFTGCEVSIKTNGDLDFEDEILKKLDIVIGSVHSGFKSSKEKMTERISNAMDNRYMKIFAHPTGRIINQRPGYEVDLEKIFEKAKDKNIVMEINAYQKRLDLDGSNIRKALQYGLKLAIGTDSHNIETMERIDLGVATARRGWAKKKDILNTYSIKDVMKFFKIKG